MSPFAAMPAPVAVPSGVLGGLLRLIPCASRPRVSALDALQSLPLVNPYPSRPAGRLGNLSADALPTPAKPGRPADPHPRRAAGPGNPSVDAPAPRRSPVEPMPPQTILDRHPSRLAGTLPISAHGVESLNPAIARGARHRARRIPA